MTRRFNFGLCTCTLLFALALGKASAADIVFYVAPGGNDSWSGTMQNPDAGGKDGPLKTLPAAQAAVRSKIAEMISKGSRAPIRVRIAPGEYRLSEPLRFSSADSGTAQAPVIYEAQVPGSAKISGAIPLGPVVMPASGAATFPAPAADLATLEGGGQLFVGDQRAILARQPNLGQHWYVSKAVLLPSAPVSLQGREAFKPTSDAGTWLQNLSSTDRSRAVLSVMQSWTASQHRIRAIPSVQQVDVTPAANWAFLSFGSAQRYFVENVGAALDSPGEWIRNSNSVQYFPTSSIVGKSVTADLPVLERLVTINGSVASGKWVEYLQFSGLVFSHTRNLTPAGGSVDWFAAGGVSAAIEIDGARYVTIDSCEISQTGGYAVWLRMNVRNTRIANCNMTDLGAGGVRIGIWNQSPSDATGTGANTIEGNRISDTGKVFPGAVGVLIGQSFDNRIVTNRIYNTTYSGIAAGHQMDYSTATSGRNLIADNLLVNIGQRTLDDMGAIYTIGPSPGTVISGNLIREVRGYGSYGSPNVGIYQDAASSGMSVENNVVIGTDGGGYRMNWGRSNTVRQNVFAMGAAGEFEVDTPDPSLPISVQSNLLFPSTINPFKFEAVEPKVQFVSNSVAAQFAPGAIDLTKCGSGCGPVSASLSYSANPKVVAVSGVPADVATRVAAVANRAGGVDSATAPPPVVVDDKPPPPTAAPALEIAENFSSYDVGAQPIGLFYSPAKDTTTISVASVAGAPPSGKCLMLREVPTNQQVYEPMVYAKLNHTAGVTVASFSLQISQGTQFTHEWRDNASPPYLVGPSLKVSAANGVEVRGKRLTTVSAGQWVHLKVTSKLGSSVGNWDLEVQDARGTQSFPDLPFGSATGWRNLIWMGFISYSAAGSQLCLADIGVSNRGIVAPTNLRLTVN